MKPNNIFLIFVFFVLFCDCKIYSQNKKTVTDIDGNQYSTITIGTQVWMVENLKVKHYRNGDTIPHIQNNAQWNKLEMGAFCEYNYQTSNSINYGNLYNWYAVSDQRNICPEGWHIPTDAEWKTLAAFLGGKVDAGGKLKETGIKNWQSPNTGSKNETGFTALPGGYCGGFAGFSDFGKIGYWWSSTADGNMNAFPYIMYFNNTDLSSYSSNKTYGFSIRCIKDN
ncbi:MAG: fibrobacter succinogenes major paralogous domain-containing protein [Bacteroidetes bacterium]|nr:fibrobacter succinogenes major paralogous domain-containing protein [Bacteroidota bacterium]